MNIDQIESKVQSIDKTSSDFIYELLRAYGLPKASISRLRSGNLNLSKVENIIIWKKRLFYQVELDADLHFTIDELVGNPNTHRHNPRFIIVTDNDTILSVDTKTGDSLDVELERLDRHYDFFLPWAGMEKSHLQNENPADIKAAEKMAKLFDEIKKDNLDDSDEFSHRLNVFMARLLFCFFAEDTNIFDEDTFTNGISSYTQEDGSDLDDFLNKLFLLLNQPESERTNTPSYLNNYPYVGGSLFRDDYKAPKFSKRSRQAIIDSGILDWSEINPDIFGSMMQSVVSHEKRESTGMHYTSVANIMKLIEPLFLNELYEQFEDAKGNEQKLNKLLHRLSNIKIFDPACGSGNFLIIAYKELRRLEIEIIKDLGQISIYSSITLDNFYGIEMDDFAHEVAILSMWLAKHQMSIEFHEEFGISKPILPLKETGKIICGNACRLDWEDVCPKDKDDEIYLLGNPPYVGFLQQTKEQKEDMDNVFSSVSNIKKLDYISCWFYLGSKYIKYCHASLAFVSTNSIVQGEQVSLFWPYIFNEMNVEIAFAYQSFKWTNNAKHNAGVTCVIINLRNISSSQKYLYIDNIKMAVPTINAYLSPTKNIIISKRNLSLSNLPKISLGSSAYDGGYLMISSKQKFDLLHDYPSANVLFKKFVGSAEFVKGIERYCLWIEDANLNFAKSISAINHRFEEVRSFRSKSKRGKTLETASTPHKFTEIRHKDKPSILVPIVTSENREYLTLGFLNNCEIIPNSARAIYDAEPYIFGILSSLMHMVWVKAVAGRLESRLRYSAGICYNSFPLPIISDKNKKNITQCVLNILEEREKYSDKTIAHLYDPDKMPEGLREAHHLNDLAVERCYRSQPFSSDGQRLEYLFTLYEKMIEEENAKGSLFEESTKKKRKRRVSA